MNDIDRRKFLGTTAGALAVALISAGCKKEQVSTPPPSGMINLGVIGAGSRGQELMRTFLRVPGVRFAGLCDVYEPRFAAAREITAEETPVYKDYRELLAARDIDAVIVATPLSFHSQHVVASLESGRHVYGEKSMAFTVEGCTAIVDAVKRTGRHYQVGAQYYYAPWYREVLRRIKEGRLGHITQIYAYWHRNNNWRRPVPDPSDRKLERLINWRMYKEYSLGLVAELGSHHISFANEVLGSAPESVVGSGGIDFWKDGRETNDNVQVTYRYPTGQTLFFSAITTNALDGSQLRVYGTEGSAVLTGHDAAIYYEPKKKAEPSIVERLLIEHGIVTGASYRPEMPYHGRGERIQAPPVLDGDAAEYLACSSFINCVRNNQRPEADEHVGLAEGVAVVLGNQAIEQGKRILFSDFLPRPGGA